MKPVFNIPFVPDEEYVNYLLEHESDISSLHFNLFIDERLDARILLKEQLADKSAYQQLQRLSQPKKFAIMNSLFYSPELFTDKTRMRVVIQALEDGLENATLDGIVYCDHHLLQYLSEEAPDVARSLEAVPGINNMLDTFAKIDAQISYIADTSFKVPGRVLLDRSLNRDLDNLAEICIQLRSRYSDLHIEVLANEGCLAYCPFKRSHDAYIAQANINHEIPSDNFPCSLGCIPLLQEQPHRILLSPFIRPEDVELYLCHVDTIKICGRSLGGAFLLRAFKAYRQRSYEGNLLNLLDATNWLAESLYIDNSQLSFDFANTLSMCDHQCDSCGFCKELFSTISCRQPFSLPNLAQAGD